MNLKIVKNIRDSVHGDLPFTRTEVRLMDTHPMQRLRGIRQLGTSYMVYPGAVHTRFEHSLGTCYMTKRIMDTLRIRSGIQISREDYQATAAAALLHDVTHIPFGHTLEDERRIFPRHDEDPKRLNHFLQHTDIEPILNDVGLADAVRELLDHQTSPPPERVFLRQIISHTICADLLDYLRRDARYCGLNLDYDDRIFRYFKVLNGRLILNLQKDGLFRHDAFSEVIQLLRFRYFLTERVYYHHAKIASGAMLSRAVERAVERGFDPERLLEISDDALVFLLTEKFGSDRAIRKLMDAFRSRRLYKRCYVITDHHIDDDTRRRLSEKYHLNIRGERRKLERRIARSARIPHESIIVYAPPPKMNLKEADVLVKVTDGDARPLGSWSNKEVLSLQEKFKKLWKFYVFLDPEYHQRFSAVAAACEEILEIPNELSLIQKGQLSLF